jgi:uncharacterized membrane protein
MEFFDYLLDRFLFLEHSQPHIFAFFLEFLGVGSNLFVCLLELTDAVVKDNQLLYLLSFFTLLVNLILHILNFNLGKRKFRLKLVP